MIRTENNVADYKSAIESGVNGQSSLFRCTDPNLVSQLGYNVEVRIPKVGDIACYDPDKKVHFIAVDTWNYGVNDDFKAMAVCNDVKGRTSKFVAPQIASNKWAAVYRWVVSGFGSVTSAEVKLQNTVIGTMTGLDGTAATLVSAFNSLVTEYKTAHSEWTMMYHMYIADDGTVYLIWDTYTADPSNTTIAGVTLTAAVGTEIPANSSVQRKNGIMTYFAGMNLLRFIQYYSVSGTTPTANVPLTEPNLVNQTSFENSPYCQLLRDTYGDYETYMDANMVKSPANQGITAPEYRDGKENTEKLAEVTYKDANGVDQIMYPAAHYPHTIGYTGVKGFEKGDGFMPSVYDGMDLFPKLTRGLGGNYSALANQDPINRSLIAIGGSGISVSADGLAKNFINRYNATRYYIYDYLGYNGKLVSSVVSTIMYNVVPCLISFKYSITD